MVETHTMQCLHVHVYDVVKVSDLHDNNLHYFAHELNQSDNLHLIRYLLYLTMPHVLYYTQAHQIHLHNQSASTIH